jgi:hypothetical protein
MAVHCYRRPDQNEAQRSFFAFPQLLDSPVFQSLIFMHMLLWTDHSCF